MSIEALKQELSDLAVVDRTRILAFLVALQDEQDPSYREMLATKIDDRNPANWVSLSELDRRLDPGAAAAPEK